MVLKTIKLRMVAILSVVAFSLALVATPVPKASALTCDQMYFGWGSSGQCVARIQSLLNGIGNYYRYANFQWLSQDGQFGPLTHNQVVAFQGFNGIAQDGVVGPVTWSHLCWRGGLVANAIWPSKGYYILQDDMQAVGCYQ